MSTESVTNSAPFFHFDKEHQNVNVVFMSPLEEPRTIEKYKKIPNPTLQSFHELVRLAADNVDSMILGILW